MPKRLTTCELNQLEKDLLYLKMDELRTTCERLSISSKGVKTQLIESICFFARTGRQMQYPKMPAVSKAKRGVKYPLARATKMLKGSYKAVFQGDNRLIFSFHSVWHRLAKSTLDGR